MTETATPAPSVWLTFRAHDAKALIRFLVEAFGFRVAVVYDEGDTVHHAELRWPEGGGVMLGSVREGDTNVAAPGSSSAYVVTADPDALHARAIAAGATITQEPHDTDYGSRDFAAVDPEGNHWSFGSYPGHPG